jgi:hypothetical protein
MKQSDTFRENAETAPSLQSEQRMTLHSGATSGWKRLGGHWQKSRTGLMAKSRPKQTRRANEAASGKSANEDGAAVRTPS